MGLFFWSTLRFRIEKAVEVISYHGYPCVVLLDHVEGVPRGHADDVGADVHVARRVGVQVRPVVRHVLHQATETKNETAKSRQKHCSADKESN